MKLIAYFILTTLMLTVKAFSQEAFTVVDDGTSPDGKYAVGIAATDDWKDSKDGAKGIFIFDANKKTRLVEITGFQGWHGEQYPYLEIRWSSDSKSIAMYTGLRKGGDLMIYSLSNEVFQPLSLPLLANSLFLDKSTDIGQPWTKLYRSDGEWLELQGWTDQQTLKVEAYGNLLGIGDNKIYFSYDAMLTLTINDGKVQLQRAESKVEKAGAAATNHAPPTSSTDK